MPFREEIVGEVEQRRREHEEAQRRIEWCCQEAEARDREAEERCQEAEKRWWQTEARWRAAHSGIVSLPALDACWRPFPERCLKAALDFKASHPWLAPGLCVTVPVPRKQYPFRWQ